MEPLIELGVTLVIGLLHRLVRNPKAAGVERGVIQHIADAANAALAAMDSVSTTATATAGSATPPAAP